MFARRVLPLVTVFALIGLAQITIIATQASAAPLWNLDIHHDQTDFPPGGTSELSFDVRNVGTSVSSGPLTLAVKLPAGLTFASDELDHGTVDGTEAPWECPGAAGKSSFSCTTSFEVHPGMDLRNLLLTVAVAPETTGSGVVSATLSGGSGVEAPAAADCPAGAGACASELIRMTSEPASFGIVDGSWLADFYKADEVTPERQAGSHPELATFSFDVNSIEGGLTQ